MCYLAARIDQPSVKFVVLAAVTRTLLSLGTCCHETYVNIYRATLHHMPEGSNYQHSV